MFSTDQSLTFYYEVYDPARQKTDAGNKNSAMRVLTSIQFFKGKVKAYETPLVEVHELNAPDRKAATFQLEVPLTGLRPGWYTCQVNVIDDAGGSFTFPRMALRIQSATPAAAAAPAGQ